MESYIISVNRDIDKNICAIDNKQLKGNISKQFYSDDNILVLLDGYLLLNNRIISFSEIISMLLNNFDIKCIVDEFNIETSGDFCLCIILKSQSKIFIIRDPMGHKVSYYSFIDDSIYITNDCKSLYSLMSHKVADETYIYNYLYYQTPGYMERDVLPIKNCYRCMAGHYTVIEFKDPKNIKCSQHKYFDVNKIPVNYGISQREAMKLFSNSINKSFEKIKPLIMDNTSIAVSGGLDSTLICSVLHSMGLSHEMKYFNYSIAETTSFSEEKYLKTIEETFNIVVERILLYNTLPSLFNLNDWNSLSENEPGTLSSKANFDLIVDKILKNESKSVIFGYVESVFRNINDPVVKLKEYSELSYLKRIQHNNDYCDFDKNQLYLKIKNALYGNCSYNLIDKLYDVSGIISYKLHEQYAANNKTLYEKFKNSTIQEIKYENIMSPNYECLANFQYDILGITSICPLHSTEILKFAIATPSFCFHRDPKFFLKNFIGIPETIINRPKISVPTDKIFRGSVPIAAKYLNKDLLVEKYINMDVFHNICKKIITGTFSSMDFRRFFSILSLEKFLENYDIEI